MQRWSNGLKTAVLLGRDGRSHPLLSGPWVGGRGGLMIGLVVALGVNGYAYFNCDKLALRACAPTRSPRRRRRSCTRSCASWPPRPASRCPGSTSARPRAPNAFATGRNPRNAAVCVTQGILELLDRARAARGARPRALARLQPRHPDQLGRRRAWRPSSPTWRTWRCSRRCSAAVRRPRRRQRAGGLLLMLSSARWRPASSRWPSAAAASTRPTRPGAALQDPLALASALRKIERGHRRPAAAAGRPAGRPRAT